MNKLDQAEQMKGHAIYHTIGRKHIIEYPG